jgi:hypothetical protein
VEHAAEPVSPVHTAPIPADDGWIGWWIRRFQPERSVGTVEVVMVHVDPKHVLQVAAPDDQQPVQTSARTVRTQRSACAFAVGARTVYRRDLLGGLLHEYRTSCMNAFAHPSALRTWRGGAYIRPLT